MKSKILVVAILIAITAFLVYELYRIEMRYWKPRIVKVEKEIVREVLGKVEFNEALKAARNSTVYAKVIGEDIYIRKIARTVQGTTDTSYIPIFIKGINFGPALPGTYPAEFAPKRDDYLRWFSQMAEAGFNTIRVYTVFPPDFYSALSEYNMRNLTKPLYLLQGIWAPVPEDEDYLNPEYVARMKAEIEKAVDAVYGGGNYYADVSQYTIGFIFGREWEPDGVLKTNRLHSDRTSYNGNFISLPKGSPMEVWLAEMLDHIQTYETIEYSGLHPVSFVNWLTLDPLYHNTEYIESPKVREYDNDLLTIDPSRLYRTEINRAGYFASYHVYPYYPDFINNEYLDCKSRFGTDNYAGYLRALRDITDGLPIVVAEFGVPSSRGVGHFNPLGMHQGGHTEREQGEIDLKLFQDIFDEGYAGGILFEWFDEWFKKNWLFMDFEIPIERNPLWHNIYDAEQTFGLVSFDPEVIRIDGNTSDWAHRKPLLKSKGKVRSLWVAYDPVYLYLKIDLDEKFDPKEDTILIAIDTYKKDLGEFKAPFDDFEFENGVEFIIELSESAKVWVAESYNIYRDWLSDLRFPMRSVKSQSGKFVEPVLIANRRRITLLGDTIPGRNFYPGRLIYGTQDENSLSDWYTDGYSIEIRLGWNVLNVTDPSSLMILQDNPSTPELDATKTDGFAFAVILRTHTGQTHILPGLRGNKIRFSKRYKWKPWDRPKYREHLKESYHVLKEGLPKIGNDTSMRTTRKRENPHKELSARILPFKGGACGAVTFSFDDGDMTQFKFAKKILEKYGARGSFGIVTSWLGSTPRIEGPPEEIKTLRMSEKEVKILSESGHEICSHGHVHFRGMYRLPFDSLVLQFRKSREILAEITGAPILTVHIPYSRKTEKVLKAVKIAGFKFARIDDDEFNDPSSVEPFRIKSFVILSDTIPTARKIYKYLENAGGKWMVLMYHHLFPDDSKELRTMESHGVLHTFSVKPITFERHVRLARNSRMWLAPIRDVAEYILSCRRASLSVSRQGNVFILRLKNADVPLSVEISGPPGIYKVRNSLSDGTYEIRFKPFVIDVEPGREVIIEKVKPLQ